MASNREERLQMRQRGAGSRKVNNVDFGFSFTPTSNLSASHSTRRTPQQQQRTPARDARSSSVLRRSARTPGTGNSRSSRSGNDVDGLTNAIEGASGERGKKRRKTTDAVPEPSQVDEAILATTEANTAGVVGQPTKRKRGRPSKASMIEIAEDFEVDIDKAPIGSLPTVSPNTPLGTTHDVPDPDKENEVPTVENGSNTSPPTKKRKKKKSISQNRSKKRSLVEGGQAGEQATDMSARSESGNGNIVEVPAVQPESETVQEANGEAMLAATGRMSEDADSDPYGAGDAPDDYSSYLMDQSSYDHTQASLGQGELGSSFQHQEFPLFEKQEAANPEPQSEPRESVEQTASGPKPRRRKRKSIAQRSNKRRSSGSVQSVNVQEPPAAVEDEVQEEPTMLEEETMLEDAAAVSESEDEYHASSPPPESVRRPKPTAPKTKRPAKARPAAQRQDRSKSAERPPRTSGGVPFTVHRLANTTALPTILEEDALSNDELHHRASFPKRSAVNGADVLAQICREAIEDATEKLDHTAQSETHVDKRNECKRKRKVVEMFGEELESRLFQLSEALEYKSSLETKVKSAKKQNEGLREEFLDIRREREEMALKMDDVRKRHLEAEAVAKEGTELDFALGHLEVAVERGDGERDEHPAAGLELLLRTVGGSVSSKGPGGGLLDRIKEFNRVLERTALVLEGRKLD